MTAMYKAIFIAYLFHQIWADFSILTKISKYFFRSAIAEPKREAEAGVALYGQAAAYGAYPYGLRAYGAYPYAFGGYYGHGLVAGASSHQHVSTPAATYGISQIHKRSADAEPEAEADAEAAAAYYGGYYGRGYGYGHGYGYGYGLGHRGYYGGYYGRGYGYGRYGYLG